MPKEDTPPAAGAAPRPTVHAVHMSSQPYVWRACDGARGYVAWEQPHEARGVYHVSAGWAYAFSSNASEVTCEACGEASS